MGAEDRKRQFQEEYKSLYQTYQSCSNSGHHLFLDIKMLSRNNKPSKTSKGAEIAVVYSYFY